MPKQVSNDLKTKPRFTAMKTSTDTNNLKTKPRLNGKKLLLMQMTKLQTQTINKNCFLPMRLTLSLTCGTKQAKPTFITLNYLLDNPNT